MYLFTHPLLLLLELSNEHLVELSIEPPDKKLVPFQRKHHFL